MKGEDRKRLEPGQNNMRLILEFAKNSENEETIKREVKEILFEMLQEYLTESGSECCCASAPTAN